MIGGGTGGCTISSKLSKTSGPNECIVLEPANDHYYQPMFTLVGGGMRTLSESVRSMKSVLPANAKWIQDEAVELNPAANEVITKQGHKITYDFLVIAVGMQLNYAKVKKGKSFIVVYMSVIDFARI